MKLWIGVTHKDRFDFLSARSPEEVNFWQPSGKPLAQFSVRTISWANSKGQGKLYHYHLLLQTQETNLSKTLRQLNGVYTQSFHRRHGRVGHVV